MQNEKAVLSSGGGDKQQIIVSKNHVLLGLIGQKVGRYSLLSYSML